MTADPPDASPQDLVIIGAGRTAGDIVWMVDELNQRSPSFRILGLLDDDADKHGTTVAGRPVLGPLDAVRDFADDVRFVIGMAHYRRRAIRLQVFDRLGLARERYATLVHPRASLAPSAQVGRGCLIFEHVVAYHETRIDDHAFIATGCVIGHYSVIERGATMAHRSILCGSATLGCGAYAGAGAIIRDDITVGAGALVGIGAVATSDVPQGITVIGNPAAPVVRGAWTPRRGDRETGKGGDA